MQVTQVDSTWRRVETGPANNFGGASEHCEGQRLVAPGCSKKRVQWRRGKEAAAALVNRPQQQRPNPSGPLGGESFDGFYELSSERTGDKEALVRPTCGSKGHRSRHLGEQNGAGEHEPVGRKLVDLSADRRCQMRSTSANAVPFTTASLVNTLRPLHLLQQRLQAQAADRLGHQQEERPSRQRAPTKRLKLPYLLLEAVGLCLAAVILAGSCLARPGEVAAAGAKLSRRSIATSDQFKLNQPAPAPSRPLSAKDKQAAAELVARHLISNYYRNHQMQRHLAPAMPEGGAEQAGRQQQQPLEPAAPTRAQFAEAASGSQQSSEWQSYEQPQSQASSSGAPLGGSGWTTSSGLMPPANLFGQQPKDQPQQPDGNQFVAYRPATPTDDRSNLEHFDQQAQRQQQFQSQSTTPTLGKQMPPPPPFYDFGLAPTNALQLEPAPHSAAPPPPPPVPAQDELMSGSSPGAAHSAPPANEHREVPMHAGGLHQRQPLLASSAQMQLSTPIKETSRVQDLGPRPARGGAINPTPSTRHASGGPLATRGGRQYSGESGEPGEGPQASPSSDSGKSGAQSEQQATPPPQPAEKGVEPRQRRRMFNRILKKAEWNHLFMELSKVFVRYFLDLALKDIIGKQSGGLSGGDGPATTTSGRKKLDAQSELTDLLKDFVKTAISNM